MTRETQPAIENNADQEVNCLVFRTNLMCEQDVRKISDVLDNLPGLREWSVDLEDWEKVLRIEGVGITSERVTEILQQEGISVEELPL